MTSQIPLCSHYGRTLPLSGSGRLDVLVRVVGLLCLISSPIWLLLLLYPPDNYEPGTAWLTFPAVLVLSLVLISRMAGRDRFLRNAMLSGMALKFISTAIFFQMFFRVWHRVGDLMGYYVSSARIANDFYARGQLNFRMPLQSTNVAVNVGGLLAILTGPSLPGFCILFGFLAFLGQMLFFKGFCRAFPASDHRVPAVLIFMLPSVAFWTSYISKDSLIFLFLGMSFYGFVRVREMSLIPVLTFATGLLGAGLIRPHIGGMLAIAYTGAFLLTFESRKYMAIVAKLVLGPILLFGTLYLISKAEHFVGAEGYDQSVARLQVLHRGLQHRAGSATGSMSLPMRVALAPLLPFRPMFWEVRKPQMALACAEGLVLLWMFWRRKWQVLESMRRLHHSAATAASLLFSLQFMIVFSIGMGNVGTLVRERVMVLPFMFFLVCSAGMLSPLPAFAPGRKWQRFPQPSPEPAVRRGSYSP